MGKYCTPVVGDKQQTNVHADYGTLVDNFPTQNYEKHTNPIPQ